MQGEPGHPEFAMIERIDAALSQIEREHDVRILLAVESGSRAWGVPSQDSDWDVQFLYIRPLPAYLVIDPRPDVIEMPITNELDLNGWDLCKALRLLVRSNAVIIEWLASPVVYRRDEAAYAALAAVARHAAHLPALEYHYDRLARRHWPAEGQEHVRLKVLFYALRPALALAWMQRHQRPPPIDLPTLMAGLDLSVDLVAEIAALTARKRVAAEADVKSPSSVIMRFIAAVLDADMGRAGEWDNFSATAFANNLLTTILLKSTTV